MYFFSVSLQLDHILSPPPMPFRKSSSPEVSSGLGKSPKFKRQLSEDGRQLRRGSLGGALTGEFGVCVVSPGLAQAADGTLTLRVCLVAELFGGL